MKCLCGSNITISQNNFAIVDGQGIIVCNKCKRAYTESEFSEHEIELAYWKTTLCLVESKKNEKKDL